LKAHSATKSPRTFVQSMLAISSWSRVGSMMATGGGTIMRFDEGVGAGAGAGAGEEDPQNLEHTAITMIMIMIMTTPANANHN
jgi:hypothetical protein